MTHIKALKLAREALTRDGWKKTGDAIRAIDEALAQPHQEPVAWKNAAIRIGEELSSVGPDGYYEMTAEHWLDLAMEQKPRGKNSLTQPQQEPDDLTVWRSRALQAEAVIDKFMAQPQQEPVYKYCADGKVIFTNPEILSRRPNKE